MRKLFRKIYENRKEIKSVLKFILFMTMLTLIFKFAPMFAWYIQEMNYEQLTIIIEWLLIVAFSMFLLTPFFKSNKGE